MAENTLTFGYWEFQGLAQPVRYLMEYYKVPYVDKIHQYRNKEEDWYKAVKPTLKTPFPNLPYLYDGDFLLTETLAIAQYVAGKTGHPDLKGKNEIDEIRISEVFGVIDQVRGTIIDLGTDPDFSKIRDSVISGKIIPQFEKLSKKLGDNEYMIGYLTYVDFFVYHYIQFLERMTPFVKDYPNLQKYVERFDSHENIKTYKASERYPKHLLRYNCSFPG